jgi:hypothetical protein
MNYTFIIHQWDKADSIRYVPFNLTYSNEVHYGY